MSRQNTYTHHIPNKYKQYERSLNYNEGIIDNYQYYQPNMSSHRIVPENYELLEQYDYMQRETEDEYSNNRNFTVQTRITNENNPEASSSLHPSRTVPRKMNENASSHQIKFLVDQRFSASENDIYKIPSQNLQQEILTRHYPASMHRNPTYKTDRKFPRALENRRGLMRYTAESGDVVDPIENHANLIVGHMEKDPSLMEDTPESEELRREALRDMPQALTIKRCVKKKLKKSISVKSTQRPIGSLKRMKYSISIKFSKFCNEMKNLTYYLQLWYNSLKTIEGHYGSGIAIYFRFLKWLFIFNCLLAIPPVIFIVIPQLFEKSNDDSWSNNNVSFSAMDLLTGEGYFTDTAMFIGFYTNGSLYINSNFNYQMPLAYFFTMVLLYVIMFCVFSVSMARSYRYSFIETKGGMKNVFALKIFCGWDYQIATKEACELKHSTLYQEIKELLIAKYKAKTKRSCLQQFQTIVLQISSHIIIIICLGGTAYLMWKLLDEFQQKSLSIFIPAVVINLVILILPQLFSLIAKYEDYKSQGTTLFVTLCRIFLLELIVVGVLVAYWLHFANTNKCWEAEIGQEVYRLIIFDFFFSVVLEALVNLGRFLIQKFIWTGIGLPDFDVARNTLHIIYNQSLLWIGFYFSPLLPIVIVIKLFLIWYIRYGNVIYISRPTAQTWRAAKAHTMFFALSFVCSVLTISTLGYILIEIESSGCGPFNGYIAENMISKIFYLEKENKAWKVLRFATKPGVIALILLALAVSTYYQRAKSQAQMDMVRLLREMLLWEAKDKEFLLERISKFTKGQWQYKLMDGRLDMYNPVTMLPLNHNKSSSEEETAPLTDSVEFIDTSGIYSPSTSGVLYTGGKKYN